MSTARAITAAVAMYFSFGNLNPVKNAPLNAPPVPISPARNPDIPPPTIAFVLDGETAKFSFHRE